MSSKFWFLFLSLLLAPLLTLIFGGLIFLSSEEGKKRQDNLKTELKQDQLIYSQKLSRHLDLLTRELDEIITTGKKQSSIFDFVAWVDSENQHIDWLAFDKKDKLAIFQSLVRQLNTKNQTHSLGWHHTSLGPVLVLDHFPSFWRGPKDLRAIVVPSKSFQLSSPNFRVFNQDGQSLFTEKGNRFLILPKMFKKKLASSKQTSSYFQIPNKNSSHYSWFFYVKQWRETNLFFVSRARIKQALLNWTSLSETWLIFSLLISLFILSTCLLFITPLYQAYTKLKESFIHLAKYGEIPRYLGESHNPFLHFYNNWNLLIQRRSQSSSKEDTKDNQNFDELLLEQEVALKKTYPYFLIKKDLNYDTRFFDFTPTLKKIVHELLLNAIQSMGDKESQLIKVSSWLKGDQFVFAVEDKGQGMDAKERARAFELYYSSKSQMGVGLNVAESLVVSHAGFIELIPLSQGLKVQVSLPLSSFLSPSLLKSTSKKYQKESRASH